MVLLSGRGLFAQTTQSGNIEAEISNIVDNMPGMNTNSFVVPSTAQMNAFKNIFTQMIAQNFSSIQSLLTPYGYTITKFYNTTSGDTLYFVKETLPVKLGWGTFIFNHKATNDLAIECPHPIWDKNTWSMGIKVFLGAKAKWFMMSGTHRYANTDSSSDMAHVTASIFYTAHTTIAPATAVQPHGFDGSSSSYNGYPDAVISCGTQYPGTIYYTLRDNYTAQGFNVGVFSYSTYSSLSLLGATTNTEGKWSNSNSKRFVHIEHDQPLRFDTTNLRKCANALIKTFSITTDVENTPQKISSYDVISAYPNPFNPATTISVSLANAGEYTLSIKNILGQTIHEIYNGYLASGYHSYRFNASDLSSGLYFCTVTGKNLQKTTKLILLK